MLQFEYTGQFKRDLKLAKRRKKNLILLQRIMDLILSQKILSPQLKDHTLSRNWTGHRELHIESDWLLIYKIYPKKSMVAFIRTGSHSDLF